MVIADRGFCFSLCVVRVLSLSVSLSVSLYSRSNNVKKIEWQNKTYRTALEATDEHKREKQFEVDLLVVAQDLSKLYAAANRARKVTSILFSLCFVVVFFFEMWFFF